MTAKDADNDDDDVEQSQVKLSCGGGAQIGRQAKKDEININVYNKINEMRGR